MAFSPCDWIMEIADDWDSGGDVTSIINMHCCLGLVAMPGRVVLRYTFVDYTPICKTDQREFRTPYTSDRGGFLSERRFHGKCMRAYPGYLVFHGTVLAPPAPWSQRAPDNLKIATHTS